MPTLGIIVRQNVAQEDRANGVRGASSRRTEQGLEDFVDDPPDSDEDPDGPIQGSRRASGRNVETTDPAIAADLVAALPNVIEVQRPTSSQYGNASP